MQPTYITQWQHAHIDNFQVRPYQQEEFYQRSIDFVREQLMEYKRTKAVKKPIAAFVNATVGAGKSLGIAMVAKHITDRGGKCLVISRQGELADQNHDEAWAIGCASSIYSASLGNKSTRYPAVFGTEGTVVNGLGGDFSAATFCPDVLLVDECHMIDYLEPTSQFMRIINYLREINPRLIVIGWTGSPFRGTESILSAEGNPHGLWYRQLCDISTEWAIEQGYLVPPHFGFPPSDDLHYDYSGVECSNATGDFTESDLERVADEQSEKLTPIMHEVVQRTADRNVVLIFAASKRHCKQIAAHLPEKETAIITADTKLEHRRAYIRAAKEYRKDDPTAGIVVDDKGNPLFGGDHRVRYLINCGTLTTGVNIPTIDVVVYLRAVGSLVLLIQSIGRGLRLCDPLGKKDCLVLDYADVMARLGGLYNSQILEQAELERSQQSGTTKQCPECFTINGEHARRCIGESRTSLDGRCEHFWKFNECPSCGTKNDITARECRQCHGELKDPNEKLTGKAYTDADLKPVIKRDFAPVKNGECLMITYLLDLGDGQAEQAREFFWPGSGQQLAKRLWKLWIVDHIRDRQWQGKAISMRTATAICRMKAVFDCPTHITHRINDKGKSIIHRRVFQSGREVGGKK